jgi:hypothetical protein
MELDAKQKKVLPKASFCPRKAAIKALSSLITTLQEQNHAIIIMIDANQASKEFISKHGTKLHSIEWLRLEHGLDDPFIDHFGKCPSMTTVHKNRDIDYIYSWGVSIDHISTLGINQPAISDHIGISIDINIEKLFECTYSILSTQPRRKLTFKNVKAKLNYISYIVEKWKLQDYYSRAQKLHQAVSGGTFNETTVKDLQQLDKEITHTLITGEDLCAKRNIQRNPWSPTLCDTVLQLSYWKKKFQMSQNKHFRWHILDSLYERTNISLQNHNETNPETIKQQLRSARCTWREVKQQGDTIRQQFLQDKAEEHARRHNIIPAKALKAIKQAELSRQTYKTGQVKRCIFYVGIIFPLFTGVDSS